MRLDHESFRRRCPTMLRLVRRLFGVLKLDREGRKRPEVLRRLQTVLVRETVRHETRSGLIKLRP